MKTSLQNQVGRKLIGASALRGPLRSDSVDFLRGVQTRPVSILCCSGRSVYKHMPNTQAYDQKRNALQFGGTTPVVAHPPCRLWSKYLRTQAKSPDPKAEMELGRWCVRQVLACGGVLEQPAGSLLWEEMSLPKPQVRDDPFLYTIYVEQWWFGFPTPKPTWVLVSGVPEHQVEPMPFRFNSEPANCSGLSHFQRSRTMPDFARWLVDTARLTWWSHAKAAGSSPLIN